MTTRRMFLKSSALASTTLMTAGMSDGPEKGTVYYPEQGESFSNKKSKKIKKPVVIATWKHGIAANEGAWKVLSQKGRALDAVEQGVRVSESDPAVRSVGYGGNPDREGNVTLDACIMDEKGDCGAVGFLQHIKNPISVARLVMEKTPHIMLVGDGALKFALKNGFQKENLLTDEAKAAWEKWLKKSGHEPTPVDIHDHDTIGMVALDTDGNLSGACTTSGLSWKFYGRVGDSPIIGAGMYVDNEVGGAAATGRGEAVIKIAGSFLVVELMRNGKSPQDACEIALERIIKKQSDYKEFQVGFIALNKNGKTGAASLKKGFQYGLYQDEQNQLIDAKYLAVSN